MMFALRFAGTMLLVAALYAQPPSLVLSQSTTAPDGTAILELSFASLPESPVAALQWTFQFPDGLTSIKVKDGPAATAARKTVICLGDAAAFKCLLVGANADAIADGVVARVAATLSAGTTQACIPVANTLGASPDGQPVIVRGENGTISVTGAIPHRIMPARPSR